MIARLLQRRDKPIFLGICGLCRTKVYHDDQFVQTAVGVAHEECMKFWNRYGERLA